MSRGAVDDFRVLRDSLRKFVKARDWDQYHSPKNLAVSVSIEAAELLECFQWVEGSSSQLAAKERKRISEEMADVLIYLIRLADKLDIDLLRAGERKMVLNARRYPVRKARGKITKYTDL
jgi:dCTP diphosphatase